MISSVSFADAGVYGCGNDYKFELEVASQPECADLKADIYENKMTKFQCQVKVTKKDLIVPMKWTFRKKTKQVLGRRGSGESDDDAADRSNTE